MHAFAVLAVMIPVAAAIWMWNIARSREILERWAQRNGVQIIHREMRLLRRGPFFWTTTKGQTVYYITAVDQQGQTRSGYVRCGSWIWGIWSDKAEVRWPEPSDEQSRQFLSHLQ